MSRVRSIAAFGSAAMLLSSTALAHVGLGDQKGVADASQVLTFGVGHGCEGADTVAIEIAIPEEVSQARGLVGPDGWGEPELVVNDALLVTAVRWEKAAARPGDDLYYQFGVRIKVPNTPFKTILFPTKQTCRDADGEETVVDWNLSAEDAAEAGEHGAAAPALAILPPRKNGWNKFKTESAIKDLSIFDDAQIVWVGDAAYSSNEATMELIESDGDVDELTEIAAKSEIWVKY